ncbi:MAG: hypothetical protein UR94_C0013G0003 [Parcubacteria group bacterium GW2011_GWA2_36_10]|nr:MAG: hypothetical protein UR94_C0013G0003 [Parcubacteria group bacterium GW2011_GWA2_36_10]
MSNAENEKLKEWLFKDALMIAALSASVFFESPKTTWMFFLLVVMLVLFSGLFLYTLYRWLRLRRNFSVSD